LDDKNKYVRAIDASHAGCHAMAEALARIGDKWTVMVVGTLQDGPLRYNEIHRIVDGISQRMLTLTLKGLEQDGLVTRTMFPTIPPRVDYELTELPVTSTASADFSLRLDAVALSGTRRDIPR
jgi:DNA-binding HxlR family transcriptional regulator